MPYWVDMFTSFGQFLLKKKNNKTTQVIRELVPVVQRVDSTSNWINNQLFPVDSSIGFSWTYPLVSDLFAG